MEILVTHNNDKSLYQAESVSHNDIRGEFEDDEINSSNHEEVK